MCLLWNSKKITGTYLNNIFLSEVKCGLFCILQGVLWQLKYSLYLKKKLNQRKICEVLIRKYRVIINDCSVVQVGVKTERKIYGCRLI
jgi:hypothetical protein